MWQKNAQIMLNAYLLTSNSSNIQIWHQEGARFECCGWRKSVWSLEVTGAGFLWCANVLKKKKKKPLERTKVWQKGEGNIQGDDMR